MKKTYDVSQEKESQLWYAHKRGFPNVPLFGSFNQSKREAQYFAANIMGLPLKEYMTLR